MLDKIIFSFDDSNPLNYRLMDLMEKYNFVKNTIFYIDIGNADLKQLVDLNMRGFKIGNHTFTHLILQNIKPKRIIQEIEYANSTIKNLQGEYPTEFCWPRGRYDDISKKIIGKYFKEARTTKVFNYKKPEDPLETNTTIHFSYPRSEYNGIGWIKLAKEYFIKAKEEKDGRFELWGHAEECNRFNEWNNLETFLKWINNNL